MSLHKGSGATERPRRQPVLRRRRPGRAAWPRRRQAPPAGRPMAPSAAYQLVHDELMLDGNARLNLATFVTTWMEPRGRPP